MEGLLAAAQDAGRTGLEAQSGSVYGDVGTSFVDDANDTHGHTEQTDAQTVGTGALPQHFTDGVRQGGDLTAALGDPGDAVCGQGQTVDQTFVQTVFPSGLNV